MKILSLQYGDDKEIVKNAANKFEVDFIDENIQATKNMDTWLDQVEACDGIVSITNTTIHGAGSLNKPTLCLLEQNQTGDGCVIKKRNLVTGIHR